MISFACSIPVAMLLLFTCEPAGGVPNTTLLNLECNTETIRSQEYAEAVRQTLIKLISNTWNRGRHYYTIHDEHGVRCYGHARCNNDIAFTVGDCKECLESARDNVNSMCSFVKGAQIALVDCYMRFEDYPFNEG